MSNYQIKEFSEKRQLGLDSGKTYIAYYYRVYVDGKDVYRTEQFSHAVWFMLEYYFKIKYLFPRIEHKNTQVKE